MDDDTRRKAALNTILQAGLTGFIGGYVIKSISGALAILSGTIVIGYEVATNVKWSPEDVSSNELSRAVQDFCNYLSLLPQTRLVAGGLEYVRKNTSYFASFIGGFLIGFGLPDLAAKSPLAMSFHAQLVLDCRDLIRGSIN